jgi:hypothetical protein
MPGKLAVWAAALLMWFGGCALCAQALAASAPARHDAPAFEPARALSAYFEAMSVPKPLLARPNQAFVEHQQKLRRHLLEDIALWPLPDHLPLDPRMTAPIQHPWCSIRRVSYQLWPGVRAGGLLYWPGDLTERPAPAVLCPHGHWASGNAHPIVQARCLMLARLGYVTFSPDQNHHEDLNLGISHQTLGVWGNMRALDFLETLPEVDPRRLGVCGESGGGLQTQMLLALDPRVRAATIVGMTCAFREILFPFNAHCDCNHFPAVMQYADAPEISALGLPTPVQYLSMNDWTRRFERDDLPAVLALFATNHCADRVYSRYEPTDHTYDRSKREQTYAWMERWLRGRDLTTPPSEPDSVPTLPPESLLRLRQNEFAENSFAGLTQFYRRHHRFSVTNFTTQAACRAWQDHMKSSLQHLLGESASLPPARPGILTLQTNFTDELRAENVLFPSEGALLIPALLLSPRDARQPLPVTILCSSRGKEALLQQEGPASPRQIARQGCLVVLPDLRFTGAYAFASLAGKLGPDLLRFQPASLLPKATDPAALLRAWERNAILWGRPLPAMTAHDLRAVLDGLRARPDANLAKVRLITRDSGQLAVAALFAAALDPRLGALDLDLAHASFENRKLPPVPFVLWHGDVPQWAALLTDRALTLRNLAEAGDQAWLESVFALQGHGSRLALPPPGGDGTPNVK